MNHHCPSCSSNVLLLFLLIGTLARYGPSDGGNKVMGWEGVDWIGAGCFEGGDEHHAPSTVKAIPW